jgi:hypothetical protein
MEIIAERVDSPGETARSAIIIILLSLGNAV